MKCPYCMGDVPDEARKCMHCGEWLKEQHPELENPANTEPATTSASGLLSRVWSGGLTQGDIVEGVRWYVKYRIIVGVVGAFVAFIILVSVIIPAFSRASRNDPFPIPGDRGPEVICPQPTGGSVAPSENPFCVSP